MTTSTQTPPSRSTSASSVRVTAASTDESAEYASERARVAEPGRRAGLRIRCPKGRGSSNLPSRTDSLAELHHDVSAHPEALVEPAVEEEPPSAREVQGDRPRRSSWDDHVDAERVDREGVRVHALAADRDPQRKQTARHDDRRHI